MLLYFYINLDRSPERNRNMLEHLRGFGIEARRVRGVDGVRLPSQLPGIDPVRFGWTHAHRLRPGEVGCYLSHLRALAEFYDSGAEFAVILEDDVELSAELPEIVRNLTEDAAPRDWDLVTMQSVHRSRALPLRSVYRQFSLAAMLFRTAGASAYLVNRHAARVLLERLLPMEVPFDHAFDRGWFLGLRVRGIYPFPARVAGGCNVAPSTIEAIPPSKYGGFRLISTLGWRTGTEVMRFYSGVKSRWFTSPQPSENDPQPGQLRGIYASNRNLLDSL